MDDHHDSARCMHVWDSNYISRVCLIKASGVRRWAFVCTQRRNALKYYEPPWEDRTQGKECHIQDLGALGSGIIIIIIHNERRSHVRLTAR